MTADRGRRVALEVRDLVARRGRGARAFALRVDELVLHRGETLVIMGPNGAGKTTLLYALAGLDGRIGAGPDPGAGPVTLVFQRPAAFSGSVAHNVRTALLGSGASRPERDRRVAAALERFGMLELADRDAHRLSGGELRRLALARALVLEPSVLLLDEPFDDLDGEGQRRLTLDLQRTVAETDLALVVVTHDLRRGLLLADRLAVLGRGRIEQSGARDDVLLHPCSPEVARTVGMTNLAEGRVVREDTGRLVVEVAPDLVVPVQAGPEPGERVWLGIRPEHLQLDVGRGGGARIGEATVRALVDDGLVTIVTLSTAGPDWTTHLLAGRGLARRLSIGEVVPLAVHPERVHGRPIAAGLEAPTARPVVRDEARRGA